MGSLICGLSLVATLFLNLCAGKEPVKFEPGNGFAIED